MKKTIVLVLVLALGLTMGVAKADFIVGVPTNLGEIVNSSAHDFGPCISSDGLELYFSSRRSGGLGIYDLWVATREDKEDDWSMPVNLGSTVNTSAVDVGPNISTDGLSLYFSSTRDGGYGGEDIYVSTRTTTEDPWGEPENLGSIVNGPDAEAEPSISGDGLSLYFHSMRDDGYGITDVYVTTRASKDDEWETPVNLGSTINSSDWDWAPEVQIDGLSLIFGSDRPEGFGDDDIYVSTRPTKDSPWGEPFNLGSAVNTSNQEARPSISADGQVLYFYSNRAGGIGGHDLWQVSIDPIVDLNGDGIVDADDMCIVVDNWGTDNKLCDVGPMPWGDGIVDVEDLIVLAEHLFEDYRLVGHWKLDETVGNIAHDSLGDNDGTLYGEPLWQPTGGQISGALECDGIDDYISTPFILDPGNGSLGAFVWIKGGVPGQVIISQTGDFGDTWLGIDPSDGKLMTGFSSMYFGDLVSETVVTDGQWHHVGFVYDLNSLHRRLYVDGAQVAEDATVVSGMPSDGGLYIGASKDLDTGTFFSGLIDDVRIYDVALTADEIAVLEQ